jgi:predicted RNase H-like HicB family nuclease
MQGEFTAKIDKALEGGYWATCYEIPGANGQGETVEEAKTSLNKAVTLILEDRIADLLQGLSNEV